MEQEVWGIMKGKYQWGRNSKGKTNRDAITKKLEYKGHTPNFISYPRDKEKSQEFNTMIIQEKTY